MSCINIFFKETSEETKEIHDRPHLGSPVSMHNFKLGTSHCRALLPHIPALSVNETYLNNTCQLPDI